MYRPSPSAKVARDYRQIMRDAGTNMLAIAGDALLGALIQMGIYEQAMRENRQRNRVSKRHRYNVGHMLDNGTRSMERRRRQIAAGSLRVENGLVA